MSVRRDWNEPVARASFATAIPKSRDNSRFHEAAKFIPPGNFAALADAVKKLAADKKLTKAMGASARQYVSKNFNRKEHSDKFVSLIDNLAT